MSQVFLRLSVTVFLSLVVLSRPAHAQVFESVGVRAQGMGGAFVAVADDATATWWNPAGLAKGGYADGVLEWGSGQQPGTPADAAPAWRTATRGLALAYPALGLSYYRFQVSELVAGGTAADGSSVRKDLPGGLSLRRLGVTQFGVTVGQSLGDHVVVATTLKLLSGGIASDVPGSGAALLDQADGVATGSETRADADLGVMLAFNGLRVGAVLKNATSPSFGGLGAAGLARQARGGVAYTSAAVGRFSSLTVAADADLTRTATVVGDVRHVTAGLESWVGKRRAALRVGISTNTAGAGGSVATAGASVPLRSGLTLDGFTAMGSDSTRKGWGIGVRVTF